MYEKCTQNNDPEIQEIYLIHDIPSSHHIMYSHMQIMKLKSAFFRFSIKT